jgi:hypothetical protein
MSHEHKYETTERHAVSAEAGEMGIEIAETRKCKGCGEETVFLLSHGNWIPLYEKSTRSEKDILLA